MRVWVPLYGMVWLAMLGFFTAMLAPRGTWWAVWIHMGLGAGIAALAYVNYRNVERTLAPARTKRVARAAWQMSVAAAVAGVFLYLGITPSLGLIPGGPIRVVHLLAAFALITQAASVATSYDMWEEKESVDSAPGPAPAPQRAERPGHSKAY